MRGVEERCECEVCMKVRDVSKGCEVWMRCLDEKCG